MKKFCIFFVFAFLLACNKNTIDSEAILKSILDIENLSDYKYEILFIRDSYRNYPYTIYFKINIDNKHYEELKENKIDNCAITLNSPEMIFESKEVFFGNHNEFIVENIPKWFDTKKKNADIWAFYNIDSLNLSNCDEYFNAWVLLQYYEGNCYLILDSAPQAD